MSIQLRHALTAALVATTCLFTPALLANPASEGATSASDDLTRDSMAALRQLYAEEPKAAEIGRKSLGILVFPSIYKAGFLIGGQGGSGVLIQKGVVTGTYSISAASFGLQAGAQAFSEVIFFTSQDALRHLQSSDGWSFGSAPSVVVVDQGAATTMNTDTLRSDMYVFMFGQKGLMAGVGIQGQKITREDH